MTEMKKNIKSTPKPAPSIYFSLNGKPKFEKLKRHYAILQGSEVSGLAAVKEKISGLMKFIVFVPFAVDIEHFKTRFSPPKPTWIEVRHSRCTGAWDPESQVDSCL